VRLGTRGGRVQEIQVPGIQITRSDPNQTCSPAIAPAAAGTGTRPTGSGAFQATGDCWSHTHTPFPWGLDGDLMDPGRPRPRDLGFSCLTGCFGAASQPDLTDPDTGQCLASARSLDHQDVECSTTGQHRQQVTGAPWCLAWLHPGARACGLTSPDDGVVLCPEPGTCQRGLDTDGHRRPWSWHETNTCAW
jgi:hypothetical protein